MTTPTDDREEPVEQSLFSDAPEDDEGEGQMPDEQEQQPEELPAEEGGGDRLMAGLMADSGEADRDAGRLTLARFASRAYLDYAISVVTDRALPNVCDGQKPVQRRILYDMQHELHLSPDHNYVKSARVVGDVLGKFHPHGDQSAYDAMVRMAQNFSLRYPLVDGHGNYGSRDGDGPAAMRYTETRLTKVSELLLSEIGLGTVDFIPNYDGAFQEPAVLPARLPFVLLNGASGIAVGMATEIPPHNMREVAAACQLLLERPDASLDEILQVLPAPDYPGGGQIISTPEAIREAYRTGRGALRVRARYEFEELARNQWRMVVTEIPPATSTAQVLSEIEAITNPKPKAGKKSLTPEQQQEKAAMLAMLGHARDESDKNVPVRIVFEPKTSKIDREAFAAALMTQTSLECNAPMNLVMIGLDGRPRQKPLAEILREWVRFRVETVRRRSRTRLDKVLDRIHILEGRQKVLLNVDEVIRVIRESEDPKPELMRVFELTERQAEDILEIKLRQLSRITDIQIERELKALREEAGALERLLGSEDRLSRAVSREIGQDAKTYGDERRTLVKAEAAMQTAVQVPDEPVTVVISEKGFIRTRPGHGHDITLMNYKMGDGPGQAIECRSTESITLLSSAGRSYSIPVASLPGSRGDGLPLSSFIDLEPGAEVVSVLCADPAATVFCAGSRGYGFLSGVGDMAVRVRSGKSFVRVDGGRALPPVVLGPDDRFIAVLSENRRLLVFPVEELRRLPSGGLGVLLMGLEEDEGIVAAIPVTGSGVTICGEGRGAKPREETIAGAKLLEYTLHRTRKGRAVPTRFVRVTGLKPAQGAKARAPELPPEDEEGNVQLL